MFAAKLIITGALCAVHAQIVSRTTRLLKHWTMGDHGLYAVTRHQDRAPCPTHEHVKDVNTLRAPYKSSDVTPCFPLLIGPQLREASGL